jgi:hypothetical protein
MEGLASYPLPPVHVRALRRPPNLRRARKVPPRRRRVINTPRGGSIPFPTAGEHFRGRYWVLPFAEGAIADILG